MSASWAAQDILTTYIDARANSGSTLDTEPQHNMGRTAVQSYISINSVCE